MMTSNGFMTQKLQTCSNRSGVCKQNSFVVTKKRLTSLIPK